MDNRTPAPSPSQPPTYDVIPPHTFREEIMRDQIKHSFLQRELKLFLAGLISLALSIGCVVLIAVTKGENCALNNGAFSILSAIGGGWLTLLSTMPSGSGIGVKSSRNMSCT